ncbi:hypothetical protein [Rhizobium paknamense]|uniref:Uncharacterized protein n=1 Tax=Rhizobium paknamense TaxID=1206817 RepID=A0ABU0IB46_9HYPH|nr:hypothetical protein [Rhizobium paknamense]MDQ0455442.1 hypothetical protein [Rhizobium paknamense]
MDKKHILPFSALALAVLLLPGLAAANDATMPKVENWTVPTETYRDLPGVRSQDAVNRDKLKPAYDCRTETELMQGRGTRDFHYLGSGMPRTVYRCTTEDGITFSGSSTPNVGGDWIPGVNPRDDVGR